MASLHTGVITPVQASQGPETGTQLVSHPSRVPVSGLDASEQDGRQAEAIGISDGCRFGSHLPTSPPLISKLGYANHRGSIPTDGASWAHLHFHPRSERDLPIGQIPHNLDRQCADEIRDSSVNTTE
jgi:hypothetical protein